jgi:hypothetical protein
VVKRLPLVTGLATTDIAMGMEARELPIPTGEGMAALRTATTARGQGPKHIQLPRTTGVALLAKNKPHTIDSVQANKKNF